MVRISLSKSSISNVRMFANLIEFLFISGSQIPFNFDLILHTKIWTPAIANDLKAHIDAWFKTLPKEKGIHSNWVVCFQKYFVHFLAFDAE